MKLRGVEYGPIFCATGARGFFGEGYPFHRWWRYLGMNWRGTTLAAKTVTLDRIEGNMPLREDGLTPKEFVPACIYIDPFGGHVVNAVALSNFGVPFYLESGRWHQLADPFILSFAAVSKTKGERLEETRQFVHLFRRYLPFKAPMALQFDFECPNVHHKMEDPLEEIGETLSIAAALNLPLIANFSVVASAKLIIATAKHPNCDALWIANTIEWGHLGINWAKIYQNGISPLVLRGFSSGGYSGPLALPFTIDRVRTIREAGLDIPIVAGNGLRVPNDVCQLFEAGTDAVAYGSGTIVRPWRTRAIIQTAHRYPKWREAD